MRTALTTAGLSRQTTTLVADHLVTDKLLASLSLPELAEPRAGVEFGHHFLFAVPLAPLGGRVTFGSLDERSVLTAYGPERAEAAVTSKDDLHILEVDRVRVAPRTTGSATAVLDTRLGRLLSASRTLRVVWRGATFERRDRVILLQD